MEWWPILLWDWSESYEYGVVAQSQRDIAANDGEGDKADGIQYQEKLVEVAHEARQHDGCQAAGNGDVDVKRMLSPGDREVAEQNVPNGATAQGG